MGRRFESRRRRLRESIGDTVAYQMRMEDCAADIGDLFYDDMMKLFDEEPEAFEGRSSKMEWEEQVVYAQQEIDTAVVSAIEKVIEEIEGALHDGQYLI